MQKAQPDEILFELLHAEIINYVVSTDKDKKESKSGNLSTLEYLGFTTGYCVIERMTKDTHRFREELDMVKFLCTEVWQAIYKKTVDSLRTNHQGVYVVQDNSFRFLNPISVGQQYLEHAPMFIAFTTGLLRGALANLGLRSIVSAEVHSMPACKFHIQVQRN